MRDMIKRETMKMRRAFNLGKEGLKKHLLHVKSAPTMYKIKKILTGYNLCLLKGITGYTNYGGTARFFVKCMESFHFRNPKIMCCQFFLYDFG